MTSELKKWRRIFYRLSLYLKLSFHKFRNEKETCLLLCLFCIFKLQTVTRRKFWIFYYTSRLTLYEGVVNVCIQRQFLIRNWTIYMVAFHLLYPSALSLSFGKTFVEFLLCKLKQEIGELGCPRQLARFVNTQKFLITSISLVYIVYGIYIISVLLVLTFLPFNWKSYRAVFTSEIFYNCYFKQ